MADGKASGGHLHEEVELEVRRVVADRGALGEEDLECIYPFAAEEVHETVAHHGLRHVPQRRPLLQLRHLHSSTVVGVLAASRVAGVCVDGCLHTDRNAVCIQTEMLSVECR